MPNPQVENLSALDEVVLPLMKMEAPAACRDIDLEHLWQGKSIRRHLHEFGEALALVLLVLGAYLEITQPLPSRSVGLVCGAGLLIMLGIRLPLVMHPVWKCWMRVGEALSVVSTMLILSLMWVSLFIPTAYVLRAVGRSVMNTAFREETATYWRTRDTSDTDFKQLERQY